MGNITGLYPCPVCKTNIVFSLQASNFNVCRNCSSILKRKGDELVKNNSIDLIYDLVSPIKIGTKGMWDGNNFEVIGMVRFWMDETAYNYWTIVFSNGKYGILSEGYGLYSICMPASLDKEHEKIFLELIRKEKYSEKLEKEYSILTKKYTVKRCEALGEFILLDWKSKLRVYEFTISDGLKFEFQQNDEDETVAYSLSDTDFDGLTLTNVSEAKYSTKKIGCHKCNTLNHIKTWPYAQSYGCTGCDVWYGLDVNGNLVSKGANATLGYFDLDLGQRANLFGVEYELLGYALKEEKTVYKSRWKEYTLFNNKEGYAFLSEFDGHWIFVKEKGECPVILEASGRNFLYGEKNFDLFNQYKYKVVYARGEFPYDIFDDEKVNVREYIAPPEMWILERSSEEGVNWFHGQHIDRKTVAQAFQKPLPYQTGVGAIQPKGFVDLKTLKITGVLVLLIALIVHLIMSFFNNEKLVMDSTFYPVDSTNAVNYVSEKFTLTKWRSNLAFNIDAPVQNNWLSLDINLVNATTGDEYSLEQGVEYYSGYDGGESWSEGSKDATDYLSSIPAGTYFLQIHSSADPYNKVNDFHLRVTNDVEMTRNLIYILILLAIPPIAYFYYRRYSETRRWSNSDYSPFTTNE